MIAHYLRLTFRHMRARRGTALINMAGLGLGIAVCLLISLYILEEHRYDAFHVQQDQLFRVNTSFKQPNGRQVTAYTAPAVGPGLQAEVPGIAQAVRFHEVTDVVRVGAEAFSEHITFADEALFEVFSFPLREGQPTQVLERHDGVVLSEGLAVKYFGETSPLGQTLAIKLGETFYDFSVTGVASAMTGPSSIRFDLVIPFARWADVVGPERLSQWRSGSIHTYIQLTEGIQPEAVTAQFPRVVETHLGAQFLESYQYQLQPIRTIHLDPSVIGGMVAASDPRYSYILGSLALLILGLAIINFTNLSVAAASSRAKEIGLRKVVGARRSELIAQFWGEALLVSVLSAGLGAGLAEVLLPLFNDIAQTKLRIDWAGMWLGIVGGIALVTGCLAGGYPAFILSAFRPTVVLKGTFVRTGQQRLTKALVTAQFILSVGLIAGAFIMQEQLAFLKEQPMGFATEQVVVIPTHTTQGADLLERYRTALEAQPEVLHVTGTSAVLGRNQFGTGYVEADAESYFFPKIFRVDPDFYTTLDIPLTHGRTFDSAFSADATTGIVVNEALVRRVGWEDPLGQTLTFYGQTYEVIGVTADFHLRSLHQAIEPVIMHADANTAISHLLVRMAGKQTRQTMARLEATWQDVAPDYPFEAFFLNEDFDQQYAADERWGWIIGYASTLAVVIACLGLFGLAFLTATQRTKEIGIRKVLGASIFGLVHMLAQDVVRMVVLALILAVPVVYLLADQWLQTFAFRINVTILPFAFAAGALLVVALITTGYHAVRSALANPVDALRYE